MVILGIDPGIARIGWGIITKISGVYKLIDYGLFETHAQDDVSLRLEKIHIFLKDLMDKYNPDVVAVEELFFAANSKTAFKVGQARGVIILAASEKGVNINSYTPLQVKQTLTGYGRADKKQIQAMVKSILNLSKPITQDDTADAVAVALTHAFSERFQKIIQRP